MPGTVVGLYCAVGSRFDLLVSTYTTATRETQAVFNQRPSTCAHGWVHRTFVQGRIGSVNLKTTRDDRAGQINEWNQDVACAAAEPSAEWLRVDCGTCARIRALAVPNGGAGVRGVGDRSRREPLAYRVGLWRETLAGRLIRGSAARAISTR